MVGVGQHEAATHSVGVAVRDLIGTGVRSYRYYSVPLARPTCNFNTSLIRSVGASATLEIRSVLERGTAV
jgi:hypothetical protein